MKPSLLAHQITFLKALALIWLAISFIGTARLNAQPSIPIELPNGHEAIQIRSAEFTELDGRLAIKGTMLQTKEIFIPRSSHLHFDFIRVITNMDGEKEDVLLERKTLLFRRTDFRHSSRLEPFFKYIDAADPAAEKIVIDVFTETHDDSCGSAKESTEDS